MVGNWERRAIGCAITAMAEKATRKPDSAKKLVEQLRGELRVFIEDEFQV